MCRADGPEHLRCIGETEFAVGMTAIGASGKYTLCRIAAGIVGFADLRLGEQTREQLEAHLQAANGRFRGVRQRAKWDADPVVKGPAGAERAGLLLDPALGHGLDLATRMGLSFDASIYHPQLPDLVQLARASRCQYGADPYRQPVGHSFYAGREAENHATWLAGMRDLATCPNVTVKLGGLLICLGNCDFSRARPST